MTDNTSKPKEKKKKKNLGGRPKGSFKGIYCERILWKEPSPKVDDVKEMIDIYDGEYACATRGHLRPKWYRKRCEEDLFFLIYKVLHREDMNNQWLYDRCREVEKEPDGFIDLWAREHYKSTIITYGLTIQEILKNPEITIGLFSFKKSIAEAFLAQIKYEFEANEQLRALYPNIVWESPNDSPSWSVQNGITVKRKTNPKERTIEACGIIDGQPVSKHYDLMIYDDIVTAESVTTIEQIKKVLERFELSLNLGSQGGRIRIIGTRYHFNDLYGTLIERKFAIPRVYPATVDGSANGKPVFHSEEYLKKKRTGMGGYTYACHSEDTMITMSDWTQKPICEVKPGDYVVGWQFGDNGKRTTLVPSKVIATNIREGRLIKSTLEDGTILKHTPDHKWWSGRCPNPNEHRSLYGSLGFGYHDYSKAVSIINNDIYNNNLSDEEKFAVGYLAAMIDGEGSCSQSGSITITQSIEFNKKVCDQIEWCLKTLNLPFSINKAKGRDQLTYIITGGRETKIRVLSLTSTFLAKEGRIARSCYGSRFANKIQLIEQRDIVGISNVYNIQTETVNYIANGIASKNCQMLQNPKADDVLGFEREWLRFWDIPDKLPPFNFYILVDPASEKGKRNDFTVMLVVGVGEDEKYYVIEMLRKRMNLEEKARALISLHRKYKPKLVGYEKYGMQSDVDGIKLVQNMENYRFEIVTLAGNTSKNDRIRRLTPYFKNGLIYIPRGFMTQEEDGGLINLTDYFVEMEYIPFPFADKDDMLDCLSRICDEKMRMVPPRGVSLIEQERQSFYPAKRLLNQRDGYNKPRVLKNKALFY